MTYVRTAAITFCIFVPIVFENTNKTISAQLLDNPGQFQADISPTPLVSQSVIRQTLLKDVHSGRRGTFRSHGGQFPGVNRGSEL